MPGYFETQRTQIAENWPGPPFGIDNDVLNLGPESTHVPYLPSVSSTEILETPPSHSWVNPPTESIVAGVGGSMSSPHDDAVTFFTRGSAVGAPSAGANAIKENNPAPNGSVFYTEETQKQNDIPWGDEHTPRDGNGESDDLVPDRTVEPK